VRLPPNFPKILAYRLRLARDMRGLTQPQLGERIGMAPAQVSHYERGTRPTVDNLRKLAVALDVTTDWLVGLSNEGPTP
jgi:transcriptional regulator with XRE-family HTH domain